MCKPTEYGYFRLSISSAPVGFSMGNGCSVYCMGFCSTAIEDKRQRWPKPKYGSVTLTKTFCSEISDN